MRIVEPGAEVRHGFRDGCGGPELAGRVENGVEMAPARGGVIAIAAGVDLNGFNFDRRTQDRIQALDGRRRRGNRHRCGEYRRLLTRVAVARRMGNGRCIGVVRCVVGENLNVVPATRGGFVVRGAKHCNRQNADEKQPAMEVRGSHTHSVSIHANRVYTRCNTNLRSTLEKLWQEDKLRSLWRSGECRRSLRERF